MALRVNDHGPGIPKTELKQIFKRFYRVPGRDCHACQRDWPGLIHRPLRGETARRSRLGGERRSGTRKHLRPATPRCQMNPAPMIRVLVVEDEQHLADGLRFNLEAEGYQVQVVETGEGALERLAAGHAQPFDVVVLDVMLPGKDGFAVMSEMRQAGQFVPTLMLTARGHPDDVLKGFAAGADDYLTKPFELSILIARIRGLLRRREWLRASVPDNAVPPASPDARRRPRRRIDSCSATSRLTSIGWNFVFMTRCFR